MKTVFFIVSAFFSITCLAQHSFSPAYTPPVHNYSNYPGLYRRPSPTAFEAASLKQLYTIVYQDSSVQTIRAEIGDYKGRTFLMIDEPGIAKTIQPKDTRSLIVGTIEKQRYVAIVGDTCWLFKIADAPINLYSLLPTLDRRFVVAVQKGAGAPIVALTMESALQMIEEGHPARKYVEKGKLLEAVRTYNGNPNPKPSKRSGSK